MNAWLMILFLQKAISTKHTMQNDIKAIVATNEVCSLKTMASFHVLSKLDQSCVSAISTYSQKKVFSYNLL